MPRASLTDTHESCGTQVTRSERSSRMKMPPEVLTRLLAGGHLNVDERKALGLWPMETLRYDEIVKHLAAVLESQEWFPQSPDAVNGSLAVREGIYVHR